MIRVSGIGIRVIDMVAIRMSDPGRIADHRFIGIGGGVAFAVFDRLQIIIGVVGKRFIDSVEIRFALDQGNILGCLLHVDGTRGSVAARLGLGCAGTVRAC